MPLIHPIILVFPLPNHKFAKQWEYILSPDFLKNNLILNTSNFLGASENVAEFVMVD